ncbi:hypothetical protein E8E13_011222 [Curvularia kusanoi]|uniref:Heterokaryon incompatibility domain-containing protein n=1 Tax=Curvularia kusanoi TaxID=90978 RepID=A0A9P4TL67_CURKU|nr:hypothetical protein E8E13_011222 [Curvularia kusanoi]
MQDVYSFATFNIAATAAKDGNVGLFYQRHPRETEPFNVDVAWILDDTIDKSGRKFRNLKCSADQVVFNAIDESPLNLRAWVIQERFLSRRIIHYSRKEVIWECHKSFVSELDPDELGSSHFIASIGQRARELKLLIHTLPSDSSCYNGTTDNEAASFLTDTYRDSLVSSWRAFRFLYSSCALTYWGDRFVAFKGISQRLEALFRDELVAGLWRSRFIEELCWNVYTQANLRKDSSWVAPSWSWVSVSGQVSPNRPRQGLVDAARVVDATVRARESGELIEATLALQCRLIAVTIKPVDESVLFDYDKTSLSQQVGDDCLIWLDDHDLLCEDQIQASLVVLRHSAVRDPYTVVEKIMVGLVLVRSAQDSGIFQRVGTFGTTLGERTPNYELFSHQLSTRYQEAEEKIINIA